MNYKKSILTVLGIGALSVALIAIPGSSTPRQSLGQSSVAVQSAGQQEIRVRARSAQEAQMVPASQEVVINRVVEDPESAIVDGDDVQVFVGSGSSWLGVSVAEVNADKVKELKLPAERGALLGKIVPDSPAAKAGLKENDVITEINGERVEGTEQFRRIIREIPAGRTVQLVVWRDGHAQNSTVTLSKSEVRHSTGGMIATPGAFAFNMPDMPELPEVWGGNKLYNFNLSGQPRIGIDAENLEGDFGNYFGAPDGKGILVRGVLPDSPAAKAGLKVGDVITSMNGEPIRTVNELREKLVERKSDKNVKLGLLRNKSALSLSVELPTPAKQPEHHISHRTNI
jgi:serine protease Do